MAQAMIEYMSINYSNIMIPSYMYSDIIKYSCSDEGSCATTGYWTKTAHSTQTSSAWYVDYGGGVRSQPMAINIDYGVRPTITLPKSILK